jgi:hypothetical protein
MFSIRSRGNHGYFSRCSLRLPNLDVEIGCVCGRIQVQLEVIGVALQQTSVNLQHNVQHPNTQYLETKDLPDS